MGSSISNNHEYELYVLLQQAAEAMNRVRDNTLKKIGLTTTQAAVLFIIKAIKGPTTPAEISRWLFREPHTVSGVLNRMEKKGLIKQTKDLIRKNWIRVSITEKGEELYQHTTNLKDIRAVLSCLSQEERATLMPYLESLRNRALKKLAVKYQLPFP